MLKIALFTPTLESVILLSPIYKHMMDEGISPLFYDVVEEGGWFEKGVQFISLGYSRPKRILRYESYHELNRLIDRVAEKDEPDIAVLAGYSKATLYILKRFREHGVRTLHLESGLRSYMEGEDEALRQAIDWTSIYNLTPSKNQFDNLSQEGYPVEQMYISGSTYVDSVLTNMTDAVTKSGILEELGITRNNYIYSYVSNEGISNSVKGLGNASLKWDLDVILPLKTKAKNILKEEGIYYSLMTDYYIMPIEQVDYLDHLNLIYNSLLIVTDDSRVALESAVMKKPVVFLNSDKDLYGLVKNGVALYKGYDELESIDPKKVRRGVDIVKLFGGGESRIRALEAIQGFSRSEYNLLEWRGLYIKRDGKLSVLEDYRSSVV